jgi:hypothetical protein
MPVPCIERWWVRLTYGGRASAERSFVEIEKSCRPTVWRLRYSEPPHRAWAAQRICVQG